MGVLAVRKGDAWGRGSCAGPGERRVAIGEGGAGCCGGWDRGLHVSLACGGGSLQSGCAWLVSLSDQGCPRFLALACPCELLLLAVTRCKVNSLSPAPVAGVCGRLLRAWGV